MNETSTRYPPRHRFWGGAVLAVAATAVLRTAYLALDDITRGHTNTLPVRVMEEGTGALAGLLMLPLIVWAAGRLRPSRVGWARAIIGHALVVLAFSLPKTALIWAARRQAADILDFAGYEYGPLQLRLLMEAPSDALTYGVVLTAVALVRNVRERRAREQQALALEREMARVQLENVRLQLQPHFLFNALNTISQAIYDTPDAADRMLGHLAALLRHVLGSAEREFIPVGEELTLLDHYLALARARFGERLEVSLEMDPTATEALVPPLLLQPLVENAIRHGLPPSGTEWIHVRVKRQGPHLECLVENAIPATSETGGSGHGLGLTLTRRRLALLYGDAASIDSAVRTPAGRSADRNGALFRVHIVLPYFRATEGALVGASEGVSAGALGGGAMSAAYGPQPEARPVDLGHAARVPITGDETCAQ